MVSVRRWTILVCTIDLTLVIIYTVLKRVNIEREALHPDICQLLTEVVYDGGANVQAIVEACRSDLSLAHFDNHHSNIVIGIDAIGVDDATGWDAILAALLNAIKRTNDQQYMILLYTDLNDTGNLSHLQLLLDKYSNILNFEVITRSQWYLPQLSKFTIKQSPSVMEILDVVHLMTVSSLRGSYYLHISYKDTVSPDIFREIRAMLSGNTLSELWISLDFGSSGISGSVMRAIEIPRISRYLLSKLGRGPVPLLFDTYVRSVYRPCVRPGRSEGVTCALTPGLGRIPYHPALVTPASYRPDDYLLRHNPRLRIPMGHEPFPWEHIPIYVNPPAIIETVWQTKGDHSLDNTYALNGHYFAVGPQKNEHLYFQFTPPVALEEFFIRCWHPEHPGARLSTDTYIDVLPMFPESVSLPKNGYFLYHLLLDGYIAVGRINERCNGEGPLGSPFGKIKTLRIRVTSDHGHDIILREVVFKQLLVPTTTKACCGPYWPNPFAGGIPGVELYNE